MLDSWIKMSEKRPSKTKILCKLAWISQIKWIFQARRAIQQLFKNIIFHSFSGWLYISTKMSSICEVAYSVITIIASSVTYAYLMNKFLLVLEHIFVFISGWRFSRNLNFAFFQFSFLLQSLSCNLYSMVSIYENTFFVENNCSLFPVTSRIPNTKLQKLLGTYKIKLYYCSIFSI